MMPNLVEFNLMKERRVTGSFKLLNNVTKCMKIKLFLFPFLRYFCPNLKGEFVIIKKLDDSEFLQINHVTVYTTETPKGFNYFIQ